MRILCVNSIIDEFGGVGFAARNLAYGLTDRGHEVHLFGSQHPDASAGSNSVGGQNGPTKVHLHTRSFPRPYALNEKRDYFCKAVWHIQDLLDPANERTFSKVIAEIDPDVIVLHSITAIGLNIWRPIRKSGIPCIQVVHDLGMICFNMAQFRSGRQCPGLCIPCRLQKWFRFSLINGASNFAFVAPSRATLDRIEKYASLSAWRTEVIPNPNTYFVRARNWRESDKPRFLYVGRLDPSKGLEMMLQAAQAAQTKAPFDLDILGSGMLEERLRQSYANTPWVHFHGSVDQETIADFMSRATALLVPSLWLENAPTVIVHALFAGLPVIASHIGGIPEHVDDGATGKLLPTGDESAWAAELARIVASPEQITTWSAACPVVARRFDAQVALDAYEKLMQAMTA